MISQYEIKTEISIAASPASVYAVLTDVERWPAWTKSVTKAELLSEKGFSEGANVKFAQPGLPLTNWIVQSLEKDSYFVWSTKMAGGTIAASHFIRPRKGYSKVILRVKYTGLLAALLGRLSSGRTKKYMKMEAAGLKKQAELAAVSLCADKVEW